MSKIKIQGNASGTGVVTLTAPNTNTDRTITLPDGDITLGGGIEHTVSASDPTVSSNPSAVGHLWINSTSGEQFIATDATTDANVWTNVGEGTGGISPPYNAEYLVIAGGGSGGGCLAGGGGAGGYRTATGFSITSATQYTVTIGAGGSSVGTSSVTGNNGSDSVFGSITSIGGGAGGRNSAGGSGGSGGGAYYYGGGGAVGSGTSGQGNDGGVGASDESSGGGGGAGAVGGAASTDNGGNGGSGSSSSITGSAVTRAGGGGGGTFDATGGSGGSGGGGDATGSQSGHGTVNTGSGGGGADYNGGCGSSGSGGSGVVILRILTTDYSGTTSGSPTVTTDGSYTVLTYNSSGTYTG
jgi:hypothetical protein